MDYYDGFFYWYKGHRITVMPAMKSVACNLDGAFWDAFILRKKLILTEADLKSCQPKACLTNKSRHGSKDLQSMESK